jgi:hypothetical protein
MSKGSTNKVSKQLVYAREQGLINWDWIVDESRSAETITSWKDTDSIINAAVRGYRRDSWQEQPNRIEIWSEKGTVRGTLNPILEKYGVTFRVMHGYSSATVMNTIAEESNQSDKPLLAFYCGDFDPSGMQMSEIDIPSRISKYGGNVCINRIALLRVDVFEGGLPSFNAATKKGDSRYVWYVNNFGHKCWELDAMSPVDLRNRVEQSIILNLDIDAWNRSLEVEKVEKKSMEEFRNSWNGTQKPNRVLPPLA